MAEFFESPTVRGMLAATFLLVAFCVAYRVIMAVRDATRTDDRSGRDLSEDFEEMRLSGDINEAELRSIKAVLDKRS